MVSMKAWRMPLVLAIFESSADPDAVVDHAAEMLDEVASRSPARWCAMGSPGRMSMWASTCVDGCEKGATRAGRERRRRGSSS